MFDYTFIFQEQLVFTASLLFNCTCEKNSRAASLHGGDGAKKRNRTYGTFMILFVGNICFRMAF